MTEPASPPIEQPRKNPEEPPAKDGDGHTPPFPRPIVKKMRWPYPLIWLVPMAAVVALGIYLYDHSKDEGPTIKVTFNDVDGLRADETLVQYRGVEIGKVSKIQLSDDHAHAVVEMRLRKPVASIAKTGALFWIVRPEISTGSIEGLGTLVTGPYIQAIPGNGPAASEFTGLEKPPLLSDDDGLWLTLHTEQADQLQGDSPVYFRGIRVGTVEDVQLGSDGSRVDMHVVVRRRYSALVHANSQFWKVSGADVKGGVLTGLEVKVNSLQSLLTGGVEFATPDTDAGNQARDGDQFILHADAKREWLAWTPKIAIEPDSGTEGAKNGSPNKHMKDAVKSAAGGK